MKGSQDEHSDTETESTPAGTQRLDKWLWFARVIKSRTLAAQLVEDGKVRVNRVRASKPSQVVRVRRCADHRRPRSRPVAEGAGGRRPPRAACGGTHALRGRPRQAEGSPRRRMSPPADPRDRRLNG